METKIVGVVGAGQMGHGIAHVMLRAGHRVVLLDVSQELVESGAKRIIKGLARDVEKERITAEQREQAVTRLKTALMPTVPEIADALSMVGQAGPCRGRHHHRGGDGEVRSQSRGLPLARAALPAGDDLRLEHFFDFHHAPRRRHPAARQVRGPALFQSRAGDEAGGSGAGPSDRARNR